MRTLVTILTWNRLSKLKKTIKFLFRYNKCNVLILDNGSGDGTEEYLTKSGIEFIKNKTNDGIFMGSRQLWYEAKIRNYDYILNLQNDFLCIRKIPFIDIENFLDKETAGFVSLNDKGTVFKERGKKYVVVKRKKDRNMATGRKIKYWRWEVCGKTKFRRNTHHFSFNPNVFRVNLIDILVGECFFKRESFLMKNYEKINKPGAMLKKPCFLTIVSGREKGWTR